MRFDWLDLFTAFGIGACVALIVHSYFEVKTPKTAAFYNAQWGNCLTQLEAEMTKETTIQVMPR